MTKVIRVLMLLVALLVLSASAPAHYAAQFVYVPKSVAGICARSTGNPHVFAKVGDSISDEQWYLYGFAGPGDYGYLAGTVDYYRGWARTGTSFDDDSVAAMPGASVEHLLSPEWSKPYDFCAGKSPLICEYDVLNPSVALIMIGTNNAVPDLQFEYDLGSVVHQTLDRGIVPVLSTIPPHAYKDVGPFNARVRTVAQAFDVPLIDYYSAMLALPTYGIRPDGVHPNYYGNGADLSDEGVQYGYNLRNLLALEALYQINVLCGR